MVMVATTFREVAGIFGFIITHNWMVLLVIAWSLDIWMIHETPVALYNVIS